MLIKSADIACSMRAVCETGEVAGIGDVRREDAPPDICGGAGVKVVGV
jgi:hypothetical protein